MYKGLKSELEGKVDKLGDGDGVLIEFVGGDRMLGYTYEKSSDDLEMRRFRGDGSTIARIVTWIFPFRLVYHLIDDITVVDPVNKE